MTQRVTAIYDAGVLRPLSPLQLQDQEVVSIVVRTSGVPDDAASDDGESLFDALNEAGLIGCVIDAPEDLSTNPKYLEGFGSSGA